MIKKLLFAAGAGVGYVLGTRAGREKYNALVSKARKVADRPEVQEVTRPSSQRQIVCTMKVASASGPRFSPTSRGPTSPG